MDFIFRWMRWFCLCFYCMLNKGKLLHIYRKLASANKMFIIRCRILFFHRNLALVWGRSLNLLNVLSYCTWLSSSLSFKVKFSGWIENSEKGSLTHSYTWILREGELLLNFVLWFSQVAFNETWNLMIFFLTQNPNTSGNI